MKKQADKPNKPKEPVKQQPDTDKFQWNPGEVEVFDLKPKKKT